MGPGNFDPRHNIDGKNKPVVIPPAYGLGGIHRVAFTGDGTELAYGNRYVAVAEMGGQGTVTEPRLNLVVQNGTEDLVTAKLPGLKAHQLSLKAPASDSMAEPESPNYASPSATRQYRTTPLKGIWQHPPYFHDGSAATLADVVRTYDTRRSLGLTAQQAADLVEYLKSL